MVYVFAISPQILYTLCVYIYFQVQKLVHFAIRERCHSCVVVIAQTNIVVIIAVKRKENKHSPGGLLGSESCDAPLTDSINFGCC
jgi:hypothetical protein